MSEIATPADDPNQMERPSSAQVLINLSMSRDVIMNSLERKYRVAIAARTPGVGVGRSLAYTSVTSAAAPRLTVTMSLNLFIGRSQKRSGRR